MTLFIPDMAGHLFLLILLFDTFQYLEAKDLPQPSPTVIPAVIKERDSVQLNCQTPPSVSECYFKMGGQVEFTLPSPCQQTLTGTLLVKWTGQSSPAEVKIQCQYSATGSQFRSIYSEPSTVTIQDIPQLTVSSTVIRETESVQLSCETPPSLPVSHCYFYMEGEKILPDSSCTQTITGTELLKRADQTFPAVVKVKCSYTVEKSQISPISDPVSVTVQNPPPPRLTVSSTVIRERDSVQLSCQTPPSVSVSQCYFYTEGSDPKPSPCTRSLTGAELLSWAGQSSSAEIKLRCFYTVETHYPSTYSHPAPITILGKLQKPDISVNDESSHDITIICVLPESVSDGHSCNLYTGDQPQAYKEAWVGRFNATLSKLFCTFRVTKNDLFRHLQLERDVSCDYRVNTGSHSLSRRSDKYIITGQKPNITVSLKENLITCLIPGSVSNDTTCNLYVGEQSKRLFRAHVWKKKHTDSKCWFCQFSVDENDLIRSLQSVRSKEVSCDYSVSSGPNSLSPRSDGYSFTVSTVTSTLTPDTPVRSTTRLTSPLTPSTAVNPTSGGQSSTESVLVSTVTSTLTPDITVRPTSLTSHLAPSTAVNPTSDLTVSPTLTTDTPKSPTERGQSSTDSVVNSNIKRVLAVQLWQAAVGMSSGVGVFLIGLTAVYLCRRTKKTNSQRPTARQDDHRQYDLVMGAMSSAGMLDSRDAGIYSLITYVPSTFLPSGPVKQSANEDADSENAGVYSLITSVPSTSIPLGPVEENGKSSENNNSDTYHVYSSIPDRPATSAQPDGLYSLLQTN